jgi:hypothetical protein
MKLVIACLAAMMIVIAAPAHAQWGSPGWGAAGPGPIPIINGLTAGIPMYNPGQAYGYRGGPAPGYGPSAYGPRYYGGRPRFGINLNIGGAPGYGQAGYCPPSPRTCRPHQYRCWPDRTPSGGPGTGSGCCD